MNENVKMFVSEDPAGGGQMLVLVVAEGEVAEYSVLHLHEASGALRFLTHGLYRLVEDPLSDGLEPDTDVVAEALAKAGSGLRGRRAVSPLPFTPGLRPVHDGLWQLRTELLNGDAPDARLSSLSALQRLRALTRSLALKRFLDSVLRLLELQTTPRLISFTPETSACFAP